jgi:D-alanyl-D-alanine carboxypeptidase/D-alanyl-D-alanine-endopeptidase (penicillin-binding protein 4)
VSEPEDTTSRRANRGKKSSRARRGAAPTAATVAVTIDPSTGQPIAPQPEPDKRGFFAKHSTAFTAASLGVVFLLLGTGAVFAGAAVGDSSPAVEPSAAPAVEAGRAVPDVIPEASRLRTCSVASLAKDSRLKGFHGAVMNAETGELLFDRKADIPERTGSVLKIITAAAALSALGPGYRISTRVVDGSRPGSIVLVGGGDPTISRVSGNTFYGGAPKLSDLASEARAAYEAIHPGVPITEIVLDASLWDVGDRWDSTWDRKGIREGYHAEVVALMVDGDRSNPSASISPRSTDAVGRAGSAFASAMGLSGVTFTRGAAVSGTVLAEVQSQPVETLIGQMMLQSDNVLGEQLARLVSIQLGMGGSAESLKRAIPAALELYEIPTTGMSIRDGSGLSRENAVTPLYMAELMVQVLDGEENLDIVYKSLPVAGQTGTLASRFTGSSAVARGQVIAKTGWIETAYGLGGVVRAKDGSKLTFAFYTVRNGIQASAKDALDALTTGVYNCGDNLSNS